MKKNVALIIITLTLLFLIKGRIETVSNITNSSEFSKVEQEYKEEKSKNLYLKERLSYVKSEDFVEKQAREKLNLTKKNEVIIVTNNNNSSNTPQQDENEKKSNLQKWWEKFL